MKITNLVPLALVGLVTTGSAGVAQAAEPLTHSLTFRRAVESYFNERATEPVCSAEIQTDGITMVGLTVGREAAFIALMSYDALALRRAVAPFDTRVQPVKARGHEALYVAHVRANLDALPLIAAPGSGPAAGPILLVPAVQDMACNDCGWEIVCWEGPDGDLICEEA